MKKELYARPYMRLKRVLDLLLALLLSPLALLIVSLCYAGIKLESHGPAFFVQERPGYKGKIFRIYKLRTMSVETERNGVPLSDMERMTRMGRVIRACSFDELPQLINILKGDMSIVGPRPERKCLADEISKEIPEFCYRLKVRGGLTGYAQIYGKYNTSAYDKLRLDMMYIENYSPLLDIRLIILTLRIIFSKDSTEGIDVAMENQRRADELWRELDEENEEKEKGGAE